MYNEIEREDKILKDNETKYNELISTPIEEIKNYPELQIKEIMGILKTYPRKLTKLRNKKSKVFRQYQSVENKINKIYRHSR